MVKWAVVLDMHEQMTEKDVRECIEQMVLAEQEYDTVIELVEIERVGAPRQVETLPGL